MKSNNFLLASSLSLILVFTYSCDDASNSGPTVSGSVTYWDGTVNISWYNESASEFTISTPEQLAGFSRLVNTGHNFRGKTVKLGANIILNDTANWRNWGNHRPANEWIPIGNYINENKMTNFQGIFDGNNFTISGIYINYNYNSNIAHTGFFGCLFSDGIIKKLGVTASYIKNGYYVGGLAGANGMVNSGGKIGGEISNSYFIGIVDGDYSSGGLVGQNTGKISNSYSAGMVLIGGGLVGTNYGLISNSYSISTVLAGGGLAWENKKFDDYVGTIINSYYDSQTSGQSDTGKGDGKTTAEMKQKETFEGWDFTNVWGISNAINGGYPYLLENPPH